MKDHGFEARLIGWLDMPGEGDPCPKDANPYPADLRDARFDAPCCLYLEADGAQRAQIPALFAREESTRAYARIAEWIACGERARNDPSSLISYMRRAALSIDPGDDARRLRPGLAAAAIPQEREDYRGIMVSLAFLHCAAGRAGIDPDPFFREVAHLARPETGEFVVSFPERDEAEIGNMVEAFS